MTEGSFSTMRQSGFAPVELPAALIVFGLLAAGTLYLFANEFPWYYYPLIVVSPLVLIFGPLFIMGVVAEILREKR